jgi:pimeloyl-ACP methyl ester carboxylesterase
MENIEIGNFLIGFRRAGTGPPLLLLHGAFSDSRAWRKQLDELSDEFTVIAWDAPGCGRSSDPPEDIGLSGYADCLAEFIDRLGLKRPHVLGLSFGGGLALELYRRHPSVPASLILASAYAGWAGSLPPDEVELRLRRALREVDLPPEQWVHGYLPGLFTKSVPQAVVDEAVAMMLDTRSAGMKAMLKGFANADLRDVLPRIEIPTLLLYGDQDQRAPRYIAEALHTAIPLSEMVIVPGVGHEINMETPEIFNTEVRRFINRRVQKLAGDI